jgi:uncharacterized repeat protein (TIGR03803 family)
MRLSNASTNLSIAVAMLIAFAPAAAQAKKDQVIYSFQGGSDGAFPESGLVQDAQGNFYGTTTKGGSNECNGEGCGTVFKVKPDGTETILHAFAGGDDGAFPAVAPLVMDSAGNLYGTTSQGGGSVIGLGTIFKISPAGNETVLYRFQGGDDGAQPNNGVIIDSAGNLYGAALLGGAANVGTVFEFTAAGKLKTLYSFTGSDGAYPTGRLLRDDAGEFYGTTAYGGMDCDGTGLGCGTVFKLAAKSKETVVYAFHGGESDGANPLGGVIMDSKGILYGATFAGGMICDSGMACGTAYKLTKNGETVLHIFTGGDDGALPSSGLLLDDQGVLYGVTQHGGTAKCNCGVLFKLSRGGTEKIVHAFGRGADGRQPSGDLLVDGAGNLYGTNFGGGATNSGAVFEVAL